MNEFLNPKSMLTPGVAGGLVMIITNSLTSQFDIAANVTALIISFTLGLVLFISMPGKIFERLVLYVLNSLVVFSVATGTNNIGITIQNNEEHAWISPSAFISEAFAQPAQPSYDDLVEQVKKLEQENRSLREELSTLTALGNEVAPEAAMGEEEFSSAENSEEALSGEDSKMSEVLGTASGLSVEEEENALLRERNTMPQDENNFFKKW